MNRRYGARGKTKKITISLVLPPHIARYMRSVANASSPKRSISSVASELLETAINSDSKPARPTSNE